MDGADAARGWGVGVRTIARPFPYLQLRGIQILTCRRGRKSDCYARYLVRVSGRCVESLKIIRQAFEKIKDEGANPRRTRRGSSPAGQREKIERRRWKPLIYHFKIFTEGFSPAPGEVFVTVENRRAESWAVSIASDGSPKPLRVSLPVALRISICRHSRKPD